MDCKELKISINNVKLRKLWKDTQKAETSDGIEDDQVAAFIVSKHKEL